MNYRVCEKIFYDQKSQIMIFIILSLFNFRTLCSEMIYNVEIKEELARKVQVEASNEQEALSVVQHLYKTEKIVLDSHDYTGSWIRTKVNPLFYKSPTNNFLLAKGDSFELLPQFNFKFDMIFADPPYFLSNGGISLQSGKVVCVDKGDWDKGKSPEEMMSFNKEWLRLCRDKLKDNGTIWISSTYHNIFSVANCLTELGYKILNVITWQKTNPPVNISCRFFTFSTEFIIWARKNPKKPHKFNYSLMKQLNGGKQMTDVWRFPAIGRWEKSQGKHPTQKPLSLLTRIILASTEPNDWILDPFSGSSTTGIAANLCGRRYAGIEKEECFCKMAQARRVEIESLDVRENYINHIADLKDLQNNYFLSEALIDDWDLPFGI